MARLETEIRFPILAAPRFFVPSSTISIFNTKEAAEKALEPFDVADGELLFWDAECQALRPRVETPIPEHDWLELVPTGISEMDVLLAYVKLFAKNRRLRCEEETVPSPLEQLRSYGLGKTWHCRLRELARRVLLLLQRSLFEEEY